MKQADTVKNRHNKRKEVKNMQKIYIVKIYTEEQEIYKYEIPADNILAAERKAIAEHSHWDNGFIKYIETKRKT